MLRRKNFVDATTTKKVVLISVRSRGDMSFRSRGDSFVTRKFLSLFERTGMVRCHLWQCEVCWKRPETEGIDFRHVYQLQVIRKCKQTTLINKQSIFRLFSRPK